MKALLTIALAFTFVISKANHENSTLSLTLFDNASFTITFDNNSFHTPSNVYNVLNITPGSHFLQVVKSSMGGNDHCGFPLVVFSGHIHVPAGSVIYATINSHNQYSIVSMQQNVTVTTSPSNPSVGGGHCGTPVPAVMSAADFNVLKSSVGSKSFDSSKLTIAKQGVEKNLLTSLQVAELMSLLSFESSKLELAKFAYKYVSDPGSYYVVNDKFSFSSSIDELDKFISKS